MSPRPVYPEHEKLKALNNDNQVIGEFIDQLNDQGLVLCDMEVPEDAPENCGFYLTRKPLSSILAEYFGIDEKKLEQEKVSMLEGLRK